MIFRIGVLFRSAILYIFFTFLKNDRQKRRLLKTSVSSLGGVYVKMMQFLTLRTNIFSKEDKLEFLGFYDQVPIEEMDIQSVLAQELSNDSLKNFTSVQPLPFASGTFGQVYKATLMNGSQVVIKVKRHHLRLSLFLDFAILKTIAFFASFILDEKIVDIRRLTREFEHITWQELDYEQEVENALLLYKFYHNHPIIVIPFTYVSLSTKHIIVQDYIGGIATTDLIRKTLEHGSQDQWLWDTYHTDFTVINKNISYSLLEQSFALDKFYSDPHPGNIKILPNNQFAFIDFGIMADSPPNKKSYFTILKIMSHPLTTENAQTLSRSFFEFTASKLLTSLETCDDYNLTSTAMTPRVLEKYKSLIEKNEDIIERLAHTKKEDYSIVWQELLRLGEQFHMQLPEGIFAALRSAFLVKSFTSLLQPHVFIMKDVYTEITDTIDVDRLPGDNTVDNIITDPEVAFEEVADWLTGLLDHDMHLYQRLMYT